MKKFTALLSVLLSLCIVVFGVGTAYYNTKRMGFDEDAVLFAQDESSFTILDCTVEYDDIKYFFEKAGAYLPGWALCC
ncbi:MAG: hypothetical protein LUH82_07705 [Clostridiales bacterium]|nr:hypothetical protein [Clostridiales bacterium]